MGTIKAALKVILHLCPKCGVRSVGRMGELCYPCQREQADD